MRTDLDHLPDNKQREIWKVVEIILDTFEEAHSRQATGWKKKGRIHRILLYGSYARGDWVWEPHTAKGYRSDYDLLIVVNTKRVAENVEFWDRLRQQFLDALVSQQMWVPVGIIIHTRQEVNSALAQGRYFFVDVAREGITLYQDDDKPLPKPRAMTAEGALALAREYFDQWYPDAGEFYDDYKANLEKGRLKKAAFELHQCVEQLYHTALLVSTFYTPHVHNIVYLRQEAAKIDHRFVHVWPEDARWQAAAFSKLKEAYVKARYSKHYRISAEQLRWLGTQAQELARVVYEVSNEHIAEREATASSHLQDARAKSSARRVAAAAR